jgi:hypothetical protein
MQHGNRPRNLNIERTFMKTQLIATAAAFALLAMSASAQAAQLNASAGVVSGNTDGFTFQQTPRGLYGGAGARIGAYTGLQTSAGVGFGPVLLGLNVMKSTSGVQVDDLSGSAGYAIPISHDFVITPGLQWGVQHVDGQSYTRTAATVGVSYAIDQQWALTSSVALGRVHGTRDVSAGRTYGDYRAGQIGVNFTPSPAVGTFTLAFADQVTQTASSLPGVGDQSMRNRAASLTYSHAF